MVATIPKGVYTMKDRYVIIKHNQEAYKKASKKIKTAIINELSKILNRNKQYVSYLLRVSGQEVIRKGNIVVVADPTKDNLCRRGRKKVYGRGVLEALKRLWRVSGYASSKQGAALLKLRDAIDIVKLSKEIEELTEKLFLAYERKLKKTNNHA
jgi:hypothetical protein